MTVRSGIVIGHANSHGHGGSLKRVGTLTKVGVSGRLGTGGQHWPWTATAHEVGAIIHLLESHVSGPVNLAGPTPATADRVMTAMAERMHRPYVFSVPEKLLELALGQAADELLLSSQKRRPQRLIDDGFRFEHTDRRDGPRRDAQQSAPGGGAQGAGVGAPDSVLRAIELDGAAHGLTCASTITGRVICQAQPQPCTPRVGLGFGLGPEAVEGGVGRRALGSPAGPDRQPEVEPTLGLEPPHQRLRADAECELPPERPRRDDRQHDERDADRDRDRLACAE